MWVFTKNGFYSAIAYDPKRHPKQAEGLDAAPGSHVLVRSRREEDIVFLTDRVGGEVMKDDSADYMFRTIVPRESWEVFLVREASDIDYTNFKDTIREPDRKRVYMSVWSAVLRLQPFREWPLWDNTGLHTGSNRMAFDTDEEYRAFQGDFDEFDEEWLRDPH